MLKLSDLTFGYSDTEFSQRVSLNLSAGDICVLRGPSGSGKSTLLSTLAGFQAPLSGSAHWNERDLLSLTPWERPLTMLFQEGNLFEGFTLFQNIAIGIRPSGRVSASETKNITQMLDIFDLQGLADRLPHQLSGGQQQRGALARAMLRKTPLLLLDEPFTGLDADRREAAISFIARLCQDQNLAILLVSHDARDAKALNASEYILPHLG